MSDRPRLPDRAARVADAGGRIGERDQRSFASALRRSPSRQGLTERTLRGVFRAGFRLAAWHLDVDLTRLPADGLAGAGCVIVVAPHRAWLEPFLLYLAWPPDAARLAWLADGHTVSRSWWRRWFLPRLGIIPIAGRPGAVRGYIELSGEVLDRGLAVVVFPEVGPPSAPDRPRRISPGFAYLALAARAPVVPVVTGGTHHIVRGSSFTLDVLDPIEIAADEADPLGTAARRDAHELAARFEDAVARLLPERNAATDARRPARDRWAWLATLFS